MQKKSQEIQRAAGGAFRFGDFDLYPAERQLKKRSKAVALPPKTFDALLILVRNAEHLVHRNQLIEALWPDTFVTDANLTNVIVSLRKILGRAAIQTVSKHGYRFTLQVVGEPGIDQDNYATFAFLVELQIRQRRLDDQLERSIREEPLGKRNHAGLEAHRATAGLRASASRRIANAPWTFRPYGVAR